MKSSSMVGQLKNNFDRFQYPFLGDNNYRRETFDNPTASEYTLKEGTVVGKDPSTGKITEFDASATNGSQIPVGIVASERTLEASATDVDVSICTSGDVKEDALTFPNGESLDTAVTFATDYTRTVRDLIEGETQGINLLGFTELSKYDN